MIDAFARAKASVFLMAFRRFRFYRTGIPFCMETLISAPSVLRGRAVAGLLACVLFPAWADRVPQRVQDAEQLRKSVPEAFADSLFDVPIAVRIELDEKYMADALVQLSRDGQLDLLEVLDGVGSDIPAPERKRYLSLLRNGVGLGDCTGLLCGGLVRIAYGVADARLALFTDRAQHEYRPERYVALPGQGGSGVLIGNQLAYVQRGQGLPASGSYQLSLIANLAHWSAYSDLQLSYADAGYGPRGRRIKPYLNNAYLQRDWHGLYARVGYLSPDLSAAQGTLAPVPFSHYDPVLGFAFGSSDSLLRRSNKPSMVPLTVSASKAGHVEIYRDGRLLATHAVRPGLQVLPTESLPDGIYPVMLRVYEEGQPVSTVTESVYKPASWNGSDRFRFRIYGGRRLSVRDYRADARGEGGMLGGIQLGYLFHPLLRAGISAQRSGDDMPVGLFASANPLSALQLYFNPYYSKQQGRGYELQGIGSFSRFSLAVSHRQSVRASRSRSYRFRLQYSSLSGDWQPTGQDRLSLRLGRAHGHRQATTDVSYYRDIRKWADVGAQAYASVSERRQGNRRLRGLAIGMNFSLGRAATSLGMGLGSQAGGGGGRESSASLNYQRTFSGSALQAVAVSANYARHGSSGTLSARLAQRYLSGDGYLQSFSSGGTTLGTNLESTVVIGGSGVLLASRAAFAGRMRAGVVLELLSDTLPDSERLVARLDDGRQFSLRRGSNFIPLDPFRPQHLSFDLAAGSRQGAKFLPPHLSVHLLPGGISRQRVEVVRMVTAVGRLIGPDGQPLAGARVRHHAALLTPEPDGLFTLELNRAHPELEVLRVDGQPCRVDLQERLTAEYKDRDVLLLGDVGCP